MANAPLVDVKGVVKRFGPKTVLKGVSFQVSKGTIHGLLGHNAAGKTTTIRIILGLLNRNGGSVRVFGVDPAEEASVKRGSGTCPSMSACTPRSR